MASDSKRVSVKRPDFSKALLFMDRNRDKLEGLDLQSLRSRMMDEFKIPFSSKTVAAMRRDCGFPELRPTRGTRGNHVRYGNRILHLIRHLTVLFVELGVEPSHPALRGMKALGDSRPHNNNQAGGTGGNGS